MANKSYDSIEPLINSMTGPDNAFIAKARSYQRHTIGTDHVSFSNPHGQVIATLSLKPKEITILGYRLGQVERCVPVVQFTDQAQDACFVNPETGRDCAPECLAVMIEAAREALPHFDTNAFNFLRHKKAFANASACPELARHFLSAGKRVTEHYKIGAFL